MLPRLSCGRFSQSRAERKIGELVAPLAWRRDGDGDRRAALGTAPSLGVLDETSCQAAAAVLRQDIEIADLREAAPFDIEQGRDGDDGLGHASLDCKRAPAGGIGEHPVKVLRDARWRCAEPFLSEEPHQQLDRSDAGIAGHRLDFAGHSPYPLATIIGLLGAWQTASMR